VINLGENGRVESFAAMSDNDRGRLRNIWETLGFHVQLRQIGKYQNTYANNPMMFIVAQVKTKEKKEEMP